MRDIWWFVIRCVVTVCVCVTIQHLVQAEGYRVDLRNLLICAVAAIVCIKFWTWTG